MARRFGTACLVVAVGCWGETREAAIAGGETPAAGLCDTATTLARGGDLDWPRAAMASAIAAAVPGVMEKKLIKTIVRDAVYGLDVLRPGSRVVAKVGDPAAVADALGRAAAGGRPARVAVVGGSVTAGHNACAPMSQWLAPPSHARASARERTVPNRRFLFF